MSHRPKNPQVYQIQGKAVSVVGAPAEIMVMPAGLHQITATQGGQPVTLTVDVTPATAATLELARRQHNGGRQRPYFDFDHEGKAASAWPSSFAWRQNPEPGVYASVEWSEAGSAAIEGKTHRSFSPTFFVDDQDPAQVTGAPLCMGALVNNPAFDSIRPIWAANAAPKKTMDPIETGGTPAPAPAVSASAPSAPTATPPAAPAPAPAPASAAAVAAPQDELAETLRAIRAERASLHIDRAIARGALPPQDEAGIARWQNLLTTSPIAAAAALAALPGSPVLHRVAGNPPMQIEAGSDLKRAIKAYAEGRTPRERGLIYSREIDAAMTKEAGLASVITMARQVRSELPIQANTLGTLVGTLVTQRSLRLLKFTFPMLDSISTDFSDENANYNQQITTRTRAVPSLSTYSAGSGYSTDAATTTDVNITINTHKGCEVVFNANELASTRRLLFGEQEEGMHYAMGLDLVQSLVALITSGNFPNNTAAALAQFGRPTLIAAAEALQLRGVPLANRHALLYTTAFGQLATDASITTLAAFRDEQYISEYMLPKVAGFQPYDAPYLPTTGNLYGFAYTSDALLLATRLPNDYTQVLNPAATGGGVVSVVTNPDTGMSVQLVEYIRHDLAEAHMRLAWMYGVAVGQANSGQRLTSQ